MEPIKHVDYSGGAKAFNIKTANLTSATSQDMTEMIFSGKMSLNAASDFYKDATIRAASMGANKDLINEYGSMAAFTSIGAEAEKMLSKDQKAVFAKNYISTIRKDGDISWLDANKSGNVDYGEMSEYQQNTLLSLNQGIGQNSISMPILNKANESIINNACFNEDGSVKFKKERVLTFVDPKETGFNIATGYLSDDAFNENILGKDINEVDANLRLKTAEAAEAGDQEKANKFGALSAFVRVGNMASLALPEEKRAGFMSNYITNREAVDTNGNGIIDDLEINKYLETVNGNKPLNIGNLESPIIGNSYFDEACNVKMNAFELRE